jgi:beta-galactosidase
MDRRDFLGSVLAGAAAPSFAGKPSEPSSATVNGRPAGEPAPAPGGNPRIRQNFNAQWRFARQRTGTGALGSFDRQNDGADQVEPEFVEAISNDYDDRQWQSIHLPHTWNAYDCMDETPGYWRGIGWYRKHFTLDGNLASKRLFLEFEGANSVAEIWLNGHRIGEHKGGYTSFEFDVTGKAWFGGRENVLTVKVDNLFRSSLPPTVKTDYTFYGGIYRDVWLRFSEPVYVSEIAWETPEVSETAADLRVRSQVINRSSRDVDLSLAYELLDPQGQSVKTLSSSFAMKAGQTLDVEEARASIASPALWSPDSPHLYRLRAALKQGTEILDVVESPCGFRWFQFDAQKGFILNGKRVQLQGTNWHQSYPGMGCALPNSRHLKDMEILREMGVNFWRTSHYPHDPATVEASDRLGLMMWEELPVNKEIGNPPEYIDDVMTMAEEMIRRDRNHPCVLVWGIAGEVNAPPNISKRVISAVARKYRELDSSRPVAMHSPRGEEIEALVDVVGLGVDKETDRKHQEFPNRPYMTAEYAASTMGRGIYGGGPESEDLACANHEKYLNDLNLRPWMAGGLIWHQFDYDGETYDGAIPHIVDFGMADLWRIPKEVFYFYQSQWTDKPMVHILGHWTWPGEEGKIRPVKVYSNAGEVELFLNGKSLGSKRDAVQGGLRHGPRLWKVAYAPGILRAVARHQGAEIADERRTAGAADHITLEADNPQLESGNPESWAYITARVVDKNGTVVPSSNHLITFTSNGPGVLLRQAWLGQGVGTTWPAVAGITRVAFQATNRTGRATISAYAPGLKMGRIEIPVAAAGKPDEMEYVEKFEVDEP